MLVSKFKISVAIVGLFDLVYCVGTVIAKNSQARSHLSCFRSVHPILYA